MADSTAGLRGPQPNPATITDAGTTHCRFCQSPDPKLAFVAGQQWDQPALLRTRVFPRACVPAC